MSTFESPATTQQARTGNPRVAVIIPSLHGDVRRVRASLERQTFRDYELHVITGVSPAARARNQGVAEATSEYYLFIDDDAYFEDDRALEALVRVLDNDPGCGIAGSSKILPPDASWLQRRIAAEIPRWIYPVEEHDTESNPPLDKYGFTGITTTCCLVRRSVFSAVGGFDEGLLTGPEDTEFFYRVRGAGHRFVIPAHCWVCHDPPKTLRSLLRKSFQYGRGHAQEALKAPERGMAIIPLSRWYGWLAILLSPWFFVPSIFASPYFDPVRRIRLGFRPIKALSTYATLYGYTWAWYHARN